MGEMINTKLDFTNYDSKCFLNQIKCEYCGEYFKEDNHGNCASCGSSSERYAEYLFRKHSMCLSQNNGYPVFNPEYRRI